MLKGQYLFQSLGQKIDVIVTDVQRRCDPDGMTMAGGYNDSLVDKSQALVGIFQDGRKDISPIIWTKNHWFVTANRDSLRHDFYHYFLDRLYEQNKPLSEHDKATYAFIKDDD